MQSCICNLSSISHITPIMDQITTELVRFHGAKLIELKFTRNAINNISVIDPTDLPQPDVTILAPVPNVRKTPSDCLVELMLAVHRLRVMGATSFHIIFTVTPFDGSGSRTSPTTAGFKLLSNFLNSATDIRKVTLFGPHSSQIEDSINVPRKIVSHSEILDLKQYTADMVHPKFVSPDIGGYYNTLHVSSGLTNKPVYCMSEGTVLPEDMYGEDLIIVDDMCITGDKILRTYEAVKTQNPNSITIAVTHVLNQQAVHVLHSLLDDPCVRVVISDTLLTIKHDRCIIKSMRDHIFRSFRGTNDRSS